MEFHKVVEAIFKFQSEHQRTVKEVRLHPEDMASVANGISFMFIPEVAPLLKAGATGYACGVEWYEDAAVPLGEIRLV